MHDVRLPRENAPDESAQSDNVRRTFRHAAQGRFDEALECFGVCQARRPADVSVRANKSDALRMAGRFEEAMAELDAIESELERDDTATGRRQAAVARAARPSLEAKDLAWAEMMERTDLPNAILEATIAGFVQPDQVDLLSHFRQRFFEEIVRAWDAQTMEMGQSLAMGLYPSLIVEAKTIRETDEFLARDDINPALRRLVIEGRDGVNRSMRARAADA